MRRSLGIEISPAGIRWAEVEEEHGQAAIRGAGAAPAGAGERATAEALRVLALERGWAHPLHRWGGAGSGREVVVSLPRAAVTLRWVTLPRPEGARAREETAGMVELEALPSLPFPIEDAAWDFVSFPAAEGRQEVLVVAARRALVQAARRQVEAAGLRVRAVGVDALAMAALARELLPEAAADAVLVHLEGDGVMLACVRDGRLLLSRSVTLERLDAATLAVELRRTLVAGMMSGAGGPAPVVASTVWLTGSGADPRLAEELSRLLSGETAGAEAPALDLAGSPHHPPTAWVPVTSSPHHPPRRAALLPWGRLPGAESLAPALDTAVGLALLGLRPAAERLDLTRAVRGESERRAAGPARRRPFLVGAAVAALAAVLLLRFGPAAGDRQLADAAARAQADARQLAARRQKLETQVRMLAGAVTPVHSYLDVLNAVSRLSGPDVWLTQYTYQRGRPVVIRGAARSNDAVAQLVEGLRRSPHLDQVALGSVARAELDKKSQLSIVQFTITGSLPGDQPLVGRRARAARPVREEP